jgi:excisionase family DNA binding protein
MPITYTLQKAAEESGLSIRGLLYAIDRGELESVKSGRRRLIPADSLKDFLLGRRPAASNKADKLVKL